MVVGEGDDSVRKSHVVTEDDVGYRGNDVVAVRNWWAW